MAMNQTPAANRIHIGFFGRRNAGKSSIVNAVTGQSLTIVSPVKGTTTDPVYKTMELLPMGPVMIIDTPGIDDEGELGELRVKKTRQVLNKTDVAILVVDGSAGMTASDDEMERLIRDKNIPYIVVMNKADICKDKMEKTVNEENKSIWVSAKTGEGIYELKEHIAHLSKQEETQRKIVGDLLERGDFVVLVTPIDASAPKGRLILPQQQTIRDILDAGAVSIVVKETELKDTLERLGTKPKLVITDSQVFKQVAEVTPKDIELTSFSILFARYKGELEALIAGVQALDELEDGDFVLISEGCTHHRQCDDIGTSKIPKWVANYTGKNIQYEWSSGTEFPEDLSKYKMIIHCGGCMLNAREMSYRQKCAKDQGVPMVNYGILIAQTQGILKRSIEVIVKKIADNDE